MTQAFQKMVFVDVSRSQTDAWLHSAVNQDTSIEAAPSERATPPTQTAHFGMEPRLFA